VLAMPKPDMRMFGDADMLSSACLFGVICVCFASMVGLRLGSLEKCAEMFFFAKMRWYLYLKLTMAELL
jgi:hypothetical protein